MPRAPSGMQRINIFLQPQVLQVLKTLAKRRGTTYSQLVREALREYAVAQAKLEKEKELGLE